MNYRGIIFCLFMVIFSTKKTAKLQQKEIYPPKVQHKIQVFYCNRKASYNIYN